MGLRIGAARPMRVVHASRIFVAVVGTLSAAACSAGTSTPTPPPTAGSLPPTSPIAGRGQIAFISERDGVREIYAVNADGTGLRRLTDNSAKEGWPAWSSDGK